MQAFAATRLTTAPTTAKAGATTTKDSASSAAKERILTKESSDSSEFSTEGSSDANKSYTSEAGH